MDGRGGEEWYSSRTRTGANILYGGRGGWGGVVLLSHTYRSQYFVWWKGGVGRSGTPLAHVPEPTSTNLTLLLVEKGFLFASVVDL